MRQRERRVLGHGSLEAVERPCDTDDGVVAEPAPALEVEVPGLTTGARRGLAARRRPSGGRVGAQLLRQRRDLGIRWKIELGGQAAGVLGGVLNGAGPVTRGIERAHQGSRVNTRVGAGRDQAAAGADVAVHIARALLRLGHRAQCAGVGVVQLVSALVEPEAELDGVAQVEPIEQRAGVAPHDPLGVVLGDRRSQLMQVAGKARRVQQEPVTGREDRLVAERAAKDMHGEVEEPAGLGDVAVGPEERHGAIAGERLWPHGHDEREQRDPVPLRRRTGQGHIAGPQTGAAEKLDLDHSPLTVRRLASPSS